MTGSTQMRHGSITVPRSGIGRQDAKTRACHRRSGVTALTACVSPPASATGGVRIGVGAVEPLDVVAPAAGGHVGLPSPTAAAAGRRSAGSALRPRSHPCL